MAAKDCERLRSEHSSVKRDAELLRLALDEAQMGGEGLRSEVDTLRPQV